MKTLPIALLFFFLSVFPGTTLAGDAESEIESLLTWVGEMDGSEFVRSGKAYSAEEAEAHLRMKWGKVKKRIKSADDFIKHIASKSYLTGKEYQIRFKDGTERPSGEVLTEQLKKIRASAKASK